MDEELILGAKIENTRAFHTAVSPAAVISNSRPTLSDA